MGHMNSENGPQTAVPSLSSKYHLHASQVLTCHKEVSHITLTAFLIPAHTTTIANYFITLVRLENVEARYLRTLFQASGTF
jgi:hypothetical protein